MLAAVLNKPGKIIPQEIKKPSLQTGEVLVQVFYSGICGSDVPRVLEGRVRSFPLVVGHEFSGVVTEVGPHANQSLQGKRVAGIPLIPCHNCKQCAEGNFALCPDYTFIGSRRQGSLAQYIAVPQENVFVLDDTISNLTAAFFEPATVALHALATLDVTPASRVAVIGMGTIGILAAQALSAEVTLPVVGLNRSQQRLDIAKKSGVNNLVLTSQEDWLQKADDFTEGKGFTQVIDAVGTAATITQAFALAAPKAQISFIGTPKEKVHFSSVEWENINRKELTLKGSWMSYSNPWPGEEWEKTSHYFQEGIFTIHEAMIDRIYPLSEAEKAFARFSAPTQVAGKILVSSE